MPGRTAGRSTTARGYGSRHQQTRRALLPKAYGTPCSRCGETMEQGQELDLDHTDDRRGYIGFSHSTCNRSAAGQKAQTLSKSPEPKPRTSW